MTLIDIIYRYIYWWKNLPTDVHVWIYNDVDMKDTLVYPQTVGASIHESVGTPRG